MFLLRFEVGVIRVRRHRSAPRWITDSARYPENSSRSKVRPLFTPMGTVIGRVAGADPEPWLGRKTATGSPEVLVRRPRAQLMGKAKLRFRPAGIWEDAIPTTSPLGDRTGPRLRRSLPRGRPAGVYLGQEAADSGGQQDSLPGGDWLFFFSSIVCATHEREGKRGGRSTPFRDPGMDRLSWYRTGAFFPRPSLDTLQTARFRFPLIRPTCQESPTFIAFLTDMDPHRPCPRPPR